MPPYVAEMPLAGFKTAEAIYAAFGRGDIAGIQETLREDVEWEHDAVDHSIPWLAPRQGRAQVAAFFEALRALDIRRFEPKRILADDTMAAAVIHVEIAVRATGRVINDVGAASVDLRRAGQGRALPPRRGYPSALAGAARLAAQSLRSEHLEDVVSWTDGGSPAGGDDNQRVEASQLGRRCLEGA